MPAMTAERQNTIKRASRALLIFFIFMSVISLWGTLAGVMHPVPADSRTIAGVVFEGAAITDKVQVLWVAQALLGSALSLKILYHLIRLMMLHTKGRIFTAQNVSQVRQVGLTFIGALVIWLLVLIAAWPEVSAAQDQWTSVMPSFPGGALMGAFLFLFASRVIDEGRELREDQELVV